MSLIADALANVVDNVTNSTLATEIVKAGRQQDPTMKIFEEEISEPIDKGLFGVSKTELQAPLVLPEIDPVFQSRVDPAVVRREAQVESLSEEELEEAEILGVTKRNRLRVPLTGGLETPSAGAALQPPGALSAGTGLTVG